MTKFYSKLVKLQLFFIIFYYSILGIIIIQNTDYLTAFDVVGLMIVAGGLLGFLAFLAIYFIDLKGHTITQRFFFIDFFIMGVFVYLAFSIFFDSNDRLSNLLLVMAIPGPSVGIKFAYSKHPLVKKEQ